MSDIVLFAIGLGVSTIVASAVGLLVWGAAQEEFRRGVHVGKDLLHSADDFVEAGGTDAVEQRLRVIDGDARQSSLRRGA